VKSQRQTTRINMFRRYGFWTNPKLPPWQRNCHALRSLSLNTISTIQRQNDTAFHNLCTTIQPPPNTSSLLWLGLKYNIEKALPKPKLDQYLERLRKDVRTKYNIKSPNIYVVDNQGRQHTLLQTGYDPKLYIPSQEYIPNEASPLIEQALDTFESQLRTLVRHNNTTRRHNLPPSSRKLLQFFKRSHNFIILPTDKNLGPAIMERATYIKRSLSDHLNDTLTYQRLSQHEAIAILHKAESNMQAIIMKHKLFLPEHESTYLHRVFQLDRRIPQFYTIPKVHKSPWKTRPIVSCVNSTLGYLSKWVDRQLQKIVHLCPAYLKDSQSLLSKLRTLPKLPPTAMFVIADAVSMYTNINTQHGLDTLRNWFHLHRHDLPRRFPVDMILAATELIMTCNVFQFDDTYWLQTSGTAMGTSLACMYATVYYAYHEETILLPQFHHTERNALLHYSRLIDDTFQIWDLALLPPQFTIATFTKQLQHVMHFGTLPWEVEPPRKSVNFLDLTITLAPDGSLTTSTYVKPMNLHLYIPPTSAHPNGVLKSLIFGTLQRYWAQNSDRRTYIDTTRAFYGYLLKRGYAPESLDPVFFEAASVIDAKTATNKAASDVSNPHPETRLFLHWEYHPRDISRHDIRNVYNQTLGPVISAPPLRITQFTLAYHNPQSLRNCLTKTQLTEPEHHRVSDYATIPEHNTPPANLCHP
jgi:hypothetical protein